MTVILAEKKLNFLHYMTRLQNENLKKMHQQFVPFITVTLCMYVQEYGSVCWAQKCYLIDITVFFCTELKG